MTSRKAKIFPLLMLCCINPTVLGQVDTFFQRNTLAPTNPTFPSFGQSVDFDGQSIIVGASCENPVFPGNVGDVHIYRKQGAGWTLEQQIISQVPESFGFSVAIDGNFAAVSAVDYDSRGRVFIYEYRSDGQGGMSWQEDAVLNGTSNDGQFGHSVSIHGTTVAVGEPGNSGGLVHIYTKNGSDWNLEQEITPQTSTGSAVFFGHAVDLTVLDDGTPTLIVSDPFFNSIFPLPDRGVVFTFIRDMGQPSPTWNQVSEISPTDPGTVLSFGTSVSTDGNLLAVGSDRDETIGGAWIYRYSDMSGNPSWTFEKRYTDPSDESNSFFGESVAVFDNRLLVGADQVDFTGRDSGVIYEYLHDGSDWPSDFTRTYAFGETEIDGETVSPTNRLLGHFIVGKGNIIVSGAWGNGTYSPHDPDDNDPDGLVCVFNTTTCSAADINEDGTINFFDVGAFLDLFNSGDIAADWNGDGSLNFFDINLFITAFNEGCPPA